jgi:hypothetical protein
LSSGDEHPEHDGHGLAIAGRENEREQLRLVADLGERDNLVEMRKASINNPGWREHDDHTFPRPLKPGRCGQRSREAC